MLTQAEVGLRALSGPRKQEALEAVKVTATEMGRLTNQLLVLARVESVAAETLFAQVDLRDVVRRVVTAQATRALDAQVTLAYDEPPVPVMVAGDATLLGELASNLLDNAIRHGGPGQEVTLALAARDGAVHLHVTDEGPGIPQEHRRNVFERFYRVGGTENGRIGTRPRHCGRDRERPWRNRWHRRSDGRLRHHRAGDTPGGRASVRGRPHA